MSRMVPPPLPIAAVERDTGLPKDTLRVWERRYGFPHPVRDAMGDRVYPADQVEKLRLLKRWLDAGHRPGKVVHLPLDELQRLTQDQPERAGSAAPGAVDNYLVLLRDHDVPALRRSLGQALLSLGLERFVTELVAPLTAGIGEAWLRGDITVTQEHVYTEALQLVLRQAIGSVPESLSQAPRVLLATLPQEGHGLGLLMAEAMLCLHGCRCISLGVKVPLDGIAAAAAQTQADVVGLTFSSAFPAGQVVAGLRDLRGLLPDHVRIWAGGANLALQRRSPEGVDAVPDIAAVPALVAAWREGRARALAP